MSYLLYFFAFIGVVVFLLWTAEVVYNLFPMVGIIFMGVRVPTGVKRMLWIGAVVLFLVGLIVGLAITPRTYGQQLYTMEDDPEYTNLKGPAPTYSRNEPGYKPFSGKIRDGGVWRWMNVEELKAIDEDRPLSDKTKGPNGEWYYPWEVGPSLKQVEADKKREPTKVLDELKPIPQPKKKITYDVTVSKDRFCKSWDRVTIHRCEAGYIQFTDEGGRVYEIRCEGMLVLISREKL